MLCGEKVKACSAVASTTMASVTAKPAVSAHAAALSLLWFGNGQKQSKKDFIVKGAQHKKVDGRGNCRSSNNILLMNVQIALMRGLLLERSDFSWLVVHCSDRSSVVVNGCKGMRVKLHLCRCNCEARHLQEAAASRHVHS